MNWLKKLFSKKVKPKKETKIIPLHSSGASTSGKSEVENLSGNNNDFLSLTNPFSPFWIGNFNNDDSPTHHHDSDNSDKNHHDSNSYDSGSSYDSGNSWSNSSDSTGYDSGSSYDSGNSWSNSSDSTGYDSGSSYDNSSTSSSDW